MTLSFAAQYWDGTDAREITIDLDHPLVFVTVTGECFWTSSRSTLMALADAIRDAAMTLPDGT